VERFRVLRKGVTSNVQYVDVELRSNRALLQNLIENRNGTKIILSLHDFRGTPSLKELRRVFYRMMRLKPDVIKIVTFARSMEDNLTMLSFIPYAKAKGQEIVAFCMGERGRMSRVFSPLMGAAWTYASSSSDRASAPGQLTVGELSEIWKRLR
jgi:3-dehydroquinate dehydratase type I